MKLTSKPIQLICWTLIAVFGLESAVDPRTAAAAPAVVSVSVTPLAINAVVDPVLARGLKIHPENPLRFDLYLDTGSMGLNDENALKDEADRLIKYFMAALTIPDKDQWVNLSPIELDQIVDNAFGQTQMGRDLLAQDYILKHMASHMTNPENEFGEAFWERIYKSAYEQFGTTDIPLEANHRIWIMPDSATVYESGPQVFVLGRRMKVALEDDLPPEITGRAVGEIDPAAELSKRVAREILVPAVEKEVNGGEQFAELRQIYSAMILATWFKRRLKDSLLARGYADRSVLPGIDDIKQEDIERVYNQYLNIYREGAYNSIREEYDPATQTVVPRKYFSGGFTRVDAAQMNLTILGPGDIDLDSVAFANQGDQVEVPFEFQTSGADAAMMAKTRSKIKNKWIIAIALTALLFWLGKKYDVISFFQASRPVVQTMIDYEANQKGEILLRAGYAFPGQIDTTKQRIDGQNFDRITEELGNKGERVGYFYSAIPSKKFWDKADALNFKAITAIPDVDLTLGNWTDPDPVTGQRQHMRVGMRDRKAFQAYIENYLYYIDIYGNKVLRPSVDFVSLGNEYNYLKDEFGPAPLKAEYFENLLPGQMEDRVANSQKLFRRLQELGYLDVQGNITEKFISLGSFAFFSEDLKSDMEDSGLVYDILWQMYDLGEWYVLARETAQWLRQNYPDLPVGTVWGREPGKAALILLNNIKIWGMNVYDGGEVNTLWTLRDNLIDLHEMGFDMRDHQIAVTEFGVSSLGGEEEQARDVMRLYRQLQDFYRLFPRLFRRIIVFEKYNEYWKSSEAGQNPFAQDPHPEEHFGASEASGLSKLLADSLQANWKNIVRQTPGYVPWYIRAPAFERARRIQLLNQMRLDARRRGMEINQESAAERPQFWMNPNAIGQEILREKSEREILVLGVDKSERFLNRRNDFMSLVNGPQNVTFAIKFDARGEPEIMYFFTGQTLQEVEAMHLKKAEISRMVNGVQQIFEVDGTIQHVDVYGNLTDTIGWFNYLDNDRVTRSWMGVHPETFISKYLVEQRHYPSGALWRAFGIDDKGFTNLWYYPKQKMLETDIRVDGVVILGYPATPQRAVFNYIDGIIDVKSLSGDGLEGAFILNALVKAKLAQRINDREGSLLVDFDEDFKRNLKDLFGDRSDKIWEAIRQSINAPGNRYRIVDRFGQPLGKDNLKSIAGIANTSPYLIELPEKLDSFYLDRALVITQILDPEGKPEFYYIVDALTDKVIGDGETIFDGQEYVRFLIKESLLSKQTAVGPDQFGTYIFRIDQHLMRFVKEGDVSVDSVSFNSIGEVLADLQNIPAFMMNADAIRTDVVETLKDVSARLTGNPEDYTSFKFIKRVVTTPEGHAQWRYGILKDDYHGRAFLEVTTSGEGNFASHFPEGFGPVVMQDVIVNETFYNDDILVATQFSHTGERFLRVTELDERGEAVKYDAPKILDKEGISKDVGKAVRESGRVGIFENQQFHRITKYLLTPKGAVPVGYEYIGDKDERVFAESAFSVVSFTYLSESPEDFADTPWRALEGRIMVDPVYNKILGVVKYKEFDKTTGEYVYHFEELVREEDDIRYEVELRFDPRTSIVRQIYTGAGYIEFTRNSLPVVVSKGDAKASKIFSRPEMRFYEEAGQTYMATSEVTLSSTRREEEQIKIYRLNTDSIFEWMGTYLRNPDTGDSRWDRDRYTTRETERGLNSAIPNKYKTELNRLKKAILKQGYLIDMKNIKYPSDTWNDWFRKGQRDYWGIAAIFGILTLMRYGYRRQIRYQKKNRSVFRDEDRAMLEADSRLGVELTDQLLKNQVLMGVSLIIPKHIPPKPQKDDVDFKNKSAKRREFLEYYLKGYGFFGDDLERMIGEYEAGVTLKLPEIAKTRLMIPQDISADSANRREFLESYFKGYSISDKDRDRLIKEFESKGYVELSKSQTTPWISLDQLQTDILSAAKARHPHALVLQELLDKDLVKIEDIQKVLERKTREYRFVNIGRRPGKGFLWQAALTYAVSAAEAVVLSDIKAGNFSRVDLLPNTYEANALRKLLEHDVLSRDEIAAYANKQTRRGKDFHEFLPNFVTLLLQDKVINPISENVLGQTGIQFAYEPDRELAFETIYARTHSYIMRNPDSLKGLANFRLKTDALANVIINPFPFNDFLEPVSVREEALNVLLQQNPSQTGGVTLGGVSLMSPYVLYAVQNIEDFIQSSGHSLQVGSAPSLQFHQEIQIIMKGYSGLGKVMMVDGRAAETSVNGRKAWENVNLRDDEQYKRLFEVFSDQQIYGLFSWMIRDGKKFGRLAREFDERMDAMDSENPDQIKADDWKKDPMKVLRKRSDGFRFRDATDTYDDNAFVSQLNRYLNNTSAPLLRQRVYSSLELIYQHEFQRRDKEAAAAFEKTQQLHHTTEQGKRIGFILRKFGFIMLLSGAVAKFALPYMGIVVPDYMMDTVNSLLTGGFWGLWLGMMFANFWSKPIGVDLKQILWGHYLKIFENLEKVWEIESKGLRHVITAITLVTFAGSMTAGIAATFGLMPALVALVPSTFVYTLLATLPGVMLPVIFGTANDKKRKGLVLGISTLILFGLLPNALFPLIAEIQLLNVQTWVTLSLWALTVMPTIVSVDKIVSFVRSKMIGDSQQTSRTGRSAVSFIRGMDPRRINQSRYWEKTLGEYFQEFIEMEDENGPLMPNNESFATSLERLVIDLSKREKTLMTPEEKELWIKALRGDPSGRFVKIKSKEGFQILRDQFQAIGMQKPSVDPIAVLEPVSKHVQAAWETFSNSPINFMFNGLFNPDPETGGPTNPAGYIMKRLEEWQDVVARMRLRVGDDTPDKQSLFNALAQAGEKTDLIDLIYMNDQLTVSDVGIIDEMIRDFLNEHQMSNRSVARSMNQDVIEYHLLVAGQNADDQYADAIRNLTFRDDFVSLKLLYEQYEGVPDGEISDESVKVFVNKYESYHAFIRTKLRLMLHTEPLWRAFKFNADRTITDAPPINLFKEQLLKVQSALPNIIGIPDDKRQELQALIQKALARGSIQEYNINVEKWARLVRKENVNDPQGMIRLLYLVNKYVPDKDFFRDPNLGRAEGFADNWNKIEELSTYLNTLIDNDILYSLYDDKQDSVIIKNKNGGMSHNVGKFFRTTFNYDAYNRPTHGSEVWGPMVATIMGRNPHIAVINPAMRIWESVSEIWPGTSIYAVSQESFTGPVQRGYLDETSFYGKGIGRTAIIVAHVSPPGEDTHSFLEVQRMQPLNTSTWIGWYKYIWGRPSLLIESMVPTEMRYAFNSIRLVMDPGAHAVMFQKGVGYDKKMSHYFFFLHYINSFNVMLLLTMLPMFVGMSHFQYLTPFVFFAVTSLILMQAINSFNFLRHMEDTGSFWIALVKTLWDIIRGFAFYVSILANFFIGKILSGNEVFSFIRSDKRPLLGAWNDLEKFQATMMVDFISIFRQGAPLKGWIGLIGLIGFAIGVFVMSSSWKGVSLILIYGLASIAILTGVFVYGPFPGKNGLKGMKLSNLFVKLPFIIALILQYSWPIFERMMQGRKFFRNFPLFTWGMQKAVKYGWQPSFAAMQVFYTAYFLSFTGVMMAGWMVWGLPVLYLMGMGIIGFALGMIAGGIFGDVEARKGIVNTETFAGLNENKQQRETLLMHLQDQGYVVRSFDMKSSVYKDEYVLTPKFISLRSAKELKLDSNVLDPLKLDIRDVYRILDDNRLDKVVIVPRAALGKNLDIRKRVNAEMIKLREEASVRKIDIPPPVWEEIGSLKVFVRKGGDEKSMDAANRHLRKILDKYSMVEGMKASASVLQKNGLILDADIQETFGSGLDSRPRAYNLQVLQQQRERLNKDLKILTDRLDEAQKRIAEKKKVDAAQMNNSQKDIAPGGIIMDSGMLNLNTAGSSSVPLIQTVPLSQTLPFPRLDYIILDIRPITSLEILGRLQESENFYTLPQPQNVAALPRG